MRTITSCTTGAIFNVPAVLIVAAMSAVCYVGMRETAGANTVMVSLKVAIIVIFVIAGLKFIDTSNWHPYIPPNTGTFGHFGWSGVMQGAGDHLLLLRRLRYRLDDGARGPQSAARSADRHLGALFISTVLYVPWPRS